MSRRDPTIDPDVARELSQLDAALAGAPDAAPALLLLAADVRAQAPRMAAQFAAQLDARVENGFGGSRLRLPAWVRSRTLLLPALGVAATALVALVVALDVTGGSHGSAQRAEHAAPPRVAPAAKPAVADKVAPLQSAPGHFVTGQGSERLAPAVPVSPPRPVANAGFGRKVEKATQLSLSTTADGVQDVADGVVRVVQSLGGIVESSQVTTTSRGGTATFSLRVPVTRLDDAVRRLSALAHVSSLSQNVQDITSSFVSTASRLSDARAERRALLRALGRATTANEIASLRARLRLNASEIALYKGELNALRRRANLASVDVTVSGRGHAPSAGAGAWTPRDALHDAVRVLEIGAGAIVVGAAALAPIALLAALAALAARSLRRRRREQALDATA